MKIAFLAPRFHTNQLKLIEYLNKHGHTVIFYVVRVGQSEDHSILKPNTIELNKIFLFFSALNKNKNDYFNYKYGFPSLRELNKFRKEKFDVIIIRNPYSILTLIYTLLSKFTKTRIIFYTQREVYSQTLTKKDNFIKVLIKLFDAKWISPLYGEPKYKKVSPKIYYIPFCMDIVEYKKQWFINDSINLLSIGKFVKRKNHDLLIHALNLLPKKYKFSLTIIGEISEVTDKRYYNYIVELAKNVTYPINIKINLDRNEVFEEYKKHDIFVLPSSNELASVSNLEAMAFGLPVITSDTNNTSSYTKGNGMIFKSDSEEDLAINLIKLLENKNRIIEMGQKSLEIVKSNHNSEVVYKYLYENILNTI